MPILLVLLLGGAILSTVWQQKSISALQSENQALRQQASEMDRLRQENAQAQEWRGLADEVAKLRKDNAELNRLRNEVRQLRGQGSELEQLRAENQRLQAASQQLLQQKKVAETQFAQASAQQAAAVAAKAQADSIQCINQLKQIGLAGRMWAAGHNESLPPDFPSLNQQLTDPRILICPSDPAKTPAANWAQIQPANISYTLISPGNSTNEPEKVFIQCPLHGHACLVDGSVRSGQAAR